MNGQARNILLRKLIEVRWGDMDALEHVNNTSFLRYIEEIRVDWFNSFDGDWSNASMGPVVASITVNFRLPIVWPASLQVDLSASWKGGKSLVLSHEIRDHTDDSLLSADATVVCVWLDHASGKTRSLPEAVIRALEIKGS